MRSFAVIRADSTIKVHTTLLDLRRYGQMVFSGQPKSISSDYADEILRKVMKRPVFHAYENAGKGGDEGNRSG